MMAVEGPAPMSAPLLNSMPLSVKQLSFSRLWLHMTSQWALQSKPDRSLCMLLLESHLWAMPIWCSFQQLPAIFALTANTFTTLLGWGWKTGHQVESMEARFQRSRTPKQPVLPSGIFSGASYSLEVRYGIIGSKSQVTMGQVHLRKLGCLK